MVGFQRLTTCFIITFSNCSLSLLMILLCSSISVFSFSSPDKVRFRSSTSSWSTPPCLSLLVSQLWDTNSNKKLVRNKIDFMLLRDYTRHEASHAVKFRKIGLSRLTEVHFRFLGNNSFIKKLGISTTHYNTYIHQF